MPEELLKELKILKVKLGCKTWAELIAKLIESKKFLLDEERLEEMRKGVNDFLELREVVPSKWTGHPSALEEK
ncbi:MAG: hypothetical protein H5T50_07155 [Nitrososphaeria archaeon]|nr:hypothetical protein [Nitrososphaeria archaeon]